MYIYIYYVLLASAYARQIKTIWNIFPSIQIVEYSMQYTRLFLWNHWACSGHFGFNYHLLPISRSSDNGEDGQLIIRSQGEKVSWLELASKQRFFLECLRGANPWGFFKLTWKLMKLATSLVRKIKNSWYCSYFQPFMEESGHFQWFGPSNVFFLESDTLSTMIQPWISHMETFP